MKYDKCITVYCTVDVKLDKVDIKCQTYSADQAEIIRWYQIFILPDNSDMSPFTTSCVCDKLLHLVRSIVFNVLAFV